MDLRILKMANLVSDKFKNSLKSSMKEHIINFLERKRLSGSLAVTHENVGLLAPILVPKS